jgi:hypothetical protein
MSEFNDGFDKGFSKAKDKIAELQAENERLKGKYNELLFAVVSKHDEEARHDTALRYIREREQAVSGPHAVQEQE